MANAFSSATGIVATIGNQGSSWPGFFAQVQHLVVALRLDILCILDTRISDFDPATNKIASKLSVYFDNVDFVHSDDIANNKSWVHTFVYGYPAKRMQLDLWNEIETWKPQNDDSWVLMGDFNNVASSEEKIGGRDPNTVYMHNFVSFLNNINVTSLPAEGLPFTWSNKHQDQTTIFEKLDRVVANPSWLQIFPSACVENLPMVGSDHSPVVLTTLPVKVIKTRSFRVEAVWQTHSDFPDLVRNSWKETIEDDPLKNFVAISNAFSNYISSWSKVVFGNFLNNSTKLQNDVNFYQNQLMMFPDSIYLKNKVLETNRELMNFYQKEEIYWAQRAKENWLSLGDNNTKYFHTHATIRKQKNKIVGIKNDLDMWITDYDDIASVFVQSFKNRFSSAGNMDFSFCDIINGGISDIDNDLILAPATMLEVEKAVNSIGSLKAPGPDGLNALFFQKNWESLKGSIFSLVTNFFDNKIDCYYAGSRKGSELYWKPEGSRP
ncbi:hypothetical protein ACLB2K_037013 [Fragaria x ananassa]